MTVAVQPKPPRWLEPDKRELTLATEAILDETMPLSRVRALTDAGGGLDRAFVQRASAAGLFAWPGSLADAAVIAEEWGRALAPEPWIEAHIVRDLLTQIGSDTQREQALPDLINGTRVAAWASGDLPGYWGRERLGVTSTSAALVLNGKASSVQHAADADYILLAARDGDGVSQFLVPSTSAGIRCERREGLDITRPRYDVTFDNVALLPDALIGARGMADLERQVQHAIVLVTSQTVGAMRLLLDRAVAYAKTRFAFGRPIGSFQAVKHLLVEASLGVETSAAMRDAALNAVVAGQVDAAEIVSMAKSCVARNGIEVAHAAWQVFGGIAYMWEDDFHLYLRRITADAAFLGSADWHHARIAALHALSTPESAA